MVTWAWTAATWSTTSRTSLVCLRCPRATTQRRGCWSASAPVSATQRRTAWTS
ncbi:hypothetical protein PF005_g22993 [Phytophthora fragariae]|uniref:Uncharacterized protein n=1 Tax=Phytophthora fragariae TaxID=53985 RepID=A0A6A3W982_9STRA|nr:hypothetical protein PF010_g11955 [Phytophthora fragariae]KAE9181134.1 hypothetical protein PF005_g22993 [Phytophthora fragariae]KAE9229179.1 hypothetical protein PF002_g13382 [Phytophthora fragariae]